MATATSAMRKLNVMMREYLDHWGFKKSPSNSAGHRAHIELSEGGYITVEGRFSTFDLNQREIALVCKIADLIDDFKAGKDSV